MLKYCPNRPNAIQHPHMPWDSAKGYQDHQWLHGKARKLQTSRKELKLIIPLYSIYQPGHIRVLNRTKGGGIV